MGEKRGDRGEGGGGDRKREDGKGPLAQISNYPYKTYVCIYIHMYHCSPSSLYR